MQKFSFKNDAISKLFFQILTKTRIKAKEIDVCFVRIVFKNDNR